MDSPSSPVAQAPHGASSVEVYGFVGWVTSAAAFLTYLLWAYVPEAWLHAAGLTYYPDKQWALAVPCWLCVAAVFAFWAYECACLAITLPPHDGRTLADDTPVWEEGQALRGWGDWEGIPPLKDVAPATVSRMLFLGSAGGGGR